MLVIFLLVKLIVLYICNIYNPISMLPEHLHSTLLSQPKLPENTRNKRKLFPSLFIAHYLLAGPPLPHTPPFTGRPRHTHSY